MDVEGQRIGGRRQTGKQGKEHTNKKGIQVKEYWHRKKEL